MTDPTSDVGEGKTRECAVCGDPIDGPGHRVITWIEDDSVRTVHVCSPTCEAAYER